MLSCEKEFNPRDKYKDITIVYGLINPVDTVHYILINRAFFFSESATIVAQNPDSSLYPVEDIDVRIYEVTPNETSTKLTVRDTILNKDTGYFYEQGQRVYYFRKIFDLQNLDNTIKIEIEHKKTGKIVYAETPLVNDFDLISPPPGKPFDLTLASSIRKMKWNNAKNGRIYEVYYTLYYREGRSVNPYTDYDKDSMVWHIGSFSASRTGDGTEQIETFGFNSAAFYVQVQKDITYDTSLWRYPYEKAKITIWCGGEDLYYYHNINASQDLPPDIPEYTNLKTKLYSEELEDYKEIENESFGIFSSRIVMHDHILLSDSMVIKYLPDQVFVNRQFRPVPALED
jgi:hypothetical protein